MSRQHRLLIASLLGLRFLAIAPRLAILPFYPELMRAWDLSPALVGLLFSSYIVAYAVVLLPVGYLVDRLVPKHSLLLGLAGTCLSLILFSLAPDFLLAVVARVVMGVFAAFLFAPPFQIVAEQLPPRQVGFAYGLLEAASGVGLVSALTLFPLLSVWLDFASLHLLLAALAALLTLVTAAFRIEAHPQPTRALAPVVGDIPARGAFRILLPLTALGMFTYIGVMSWLPAALEDGYGWSKACAAWVMLFYTAAHIPTSLIVGHLTSAGARRKPLVAYGTVLTIAGCLALALYPERPTAVAVAALAIGVGGSAASMALIVLAREVVPKERLGFALGLLNTVGQIAGALASALFGWLVGLTDQYLWLWLVGALVVAVRFAIIPMLKEGRPQQQEPVTAA